MSQKRNRSINWGEEEKQLFRSVLKDYTQIIENKSLDTNTSKLKTKAWEEVHKKFSQLNSRPRDLSQLKIQWKTMKVNARKTFSTFKKEVYKTGGGARPATPDAAIIEIKDLLNPAELLRDHNEYDSDGIVIGELEFSTPSNTCPVKQDKRDNPTIISNNEFDASISKIDNQQLASTNMETIEDVDAQVATLEYTPLALTQVNAKGATSKVNVETLPVKNAEYDIMINTPIKRNVGITPAKKVPKRSCILNNILGNNVSKPKKDQNDYVSSMLSHSKMLKDEEHMRHMEMAEEEHAIKMEIQREKLKSAILEREILELRKIREASLINN